MTALVIAQAGVPFWKCLPQGTHCLYGYYSAHWQVLHWWCNVADSEKQVAGHLQNSCQFLRNGTRSSPLAIHLAQMWQRSSNSIRSAGMLRNELSCSIL
jgi:hypothetical protein